MQRETASNKSKTVIPEEIDISVNVQVNNHCVHC